MRELNRGSRIGNYTLSNPLGRTGMGEVWQARIATGGTVALKTIPSEAPNYALLRERFLREIAIHQKLRHPSIVPIYDFFEHEERLYLIMEYIPGGSLENRLDKLNGKPLPVDEAINISSQILDALDYAHQNFVIHRDVKPSNILLYRDRAYLADFGISLPVGSPRFTKVKQVIGTRFYMSPEQIVNPQGINHLTDVFSFGCVLYEMLTGRQPFAGADCPEFISDYAIETRQVNALVTPMRPLNPQVSVRLERIVVTSLAKRPEDRFAGCASFGSALVRANQATQEGCGLSKSKHLTVPLASFKPALASGRLRVYIGLHITVILIASLAPVAAFALQPETLIWLISFATIVIHVEHLIFLYKGWSAIKDTKSRVTPARAVGLLFVPFVNLIWFWIAFVSYARNYNDFVARHGLRVKKQAPGWYVAFVVTHYLLPCLMLFGNLSLIAAWMFLDFAVMTPVICAVMGNAINAIHEREAPAPLAALAKAPASVLP